MSCLIALNMAAYLFMLLGVSLASPIPGESSTLEKRAGTVAITGIKDSGIQQRLEIRQLAANPVQYNLYLLAMMQFQDIAQSETISYYQIAGVHGVPYAPWDGVQGSGNHGYCTHYSNLFSTWHRPYLALFEQQLHSAALSIAAKFPAGTARSQNEAAALSLRTPYYDWAINPPNGGPVLPAVLSNPNANVNFPNGTVATVANPLYSYRFHPIVARDLVYSPWNSYPTTLRWPTSSAPQATSQQNTANSQMASSLPGFRNQLMTLFANYQPFNSFSSAAPMSNLGNIESVHNTVHVLLGGTGSNQGHMSVVPLSAFDPIFWLHHTQLDRIAAIFQYLYPDTYVDPASQNGATYTIKAGSTQNQDSPLTPFHTDSFGGVWTSRLARNINNLGYTYPELANFPSNSTLIANINNLYGSSTTGVAHKRSAAMVDSTKTVNSTSSPPRDYITSITLPLNYQNSAYSVAIFLGPVTTTAMNWATDPNFVGSQGVLAHPDMTDSALSTANVYLSEALKARYEKGDLKGLDENSVVKYLEKHLAWRVAVNGKQVSCEDLPGLQVVAKSVEIQVNPGAETFNRWVGGFKEYRQVKSH